MRNIKSPQVGMLPTFIGCKKPAPFCPNKYATFYETDREFLSAPTPVPNIKTIADCGQEAKGSNSIGFQWAYTNPWNNSYTNDAEMVEVCYYRDSTGSQKVLGNRI